MSANNGIPKWMQGGADQRDWAAALEDFEDTLRTSTFEDSSEVRAAMDFLNEMLFRAFDEGFEQGYEQANEENHEHR